MDGSELKNALLLFLRDNILVVVLLCIGLLLFGYGLITLLPKPEESVVFHPAEIEKKSEDKKEIYVDIEGAVLRPGVYKLASASRLQDVLIHAGGFHKDADRKEIAHSINLAATVTDGAKIYIPFMGEKGVLGSTNSQTQNSQDSLININTASADLLDSLAGIGTVTAEKIIQNRPYQSIQELLTKKAVSNKVFTEIEKQITTQ